MSIKEDKIREDSGSSWMCIQRSSVFCLMLQSPLWPLQSFVSHQRGWWQSLIIRNTLENLLGSYHFGDAPSSSSGTDCHFWSQTPDAVAGEYLRNRLYYRRTHWHTVSLSHTHTLSLSLLNPTASHFSRSLVQGGARGCSDSWGVAIPTPARARPSSQARGLELWGGTDFISLLFLSLCVSRGRSDVLHVHANPHT